MSDFEIHAPDFACSSNHWIDCPGSVHMQRECPRPANKNDYLARQGRVAHLIAHQCLLRQVHASEYLGEVIQGVCVDLEMVWAVEQYVKWFGGYVKHKSLTYYEIQLRLHHIIPGCFGTADAVVLTPNKPTVFVCDFKYGNNVFVDARGNAQLLLYLLGVIHKFRAYQLTEFYIGVCQPRLANIQRIRVTQTELDLFSTRAQRAYKLVHLGPDLAPRTAGSHCTWCSGKPLCPEFRELAATSLGCTAKELTATDGTLAPIAATALSPKTLGAIYPHTKAIENWAKETRAYAETLHRSGSRIPGLKAVAGHPGRKVWSDPNMAEKLCKNMRLPKKETHKSQLLTPEQLRTKLSERRFKRFSKYIQQSEATIQLAPLTDPRPEVTDGDSFDSNDTK